jgi:hypothetical protein
MKRWGAKKIQMGRRVDLAGRLPQRSQTAPSKTNLHFYVGKLNAESHRYSPRRAAAAHSSAAFSSA